jgi:hypothetical protein
VTALAETFTETFRDEHRRVRDALLDLIEAFEQRDRARIASLLGQTAALTGPHFRYEEEALYPALTGIFERSYVDYLFGEHDAAIARARILVELAGKDSLTDDDVAEAGRLIRAILPHVSDCDGLSVMVEVLPEEEVEAILQARDRSLAAGLDLFAWADGIRGRPIAAPV